MAAPPAPASTSRAAPEERQTAAVGAAPRKSESGRSSRYYEELGDGVRPGTSAAAGAGVGGKEDKGKERAKEEEEEKGVKAKRGWGGVS